MAKSIMHDGMTCFLCGANGTMDYLHWHHIFGGPNRRWSEKFGLKVRLCGQKCHEHGPQAVHKCRKTDLYLKAERQKAFEEYHGSREEFQQIFGRNWL